MHEALDVARGGAAAGLRQELLMPLSSARSVTGQPVTVRHVRNRIVVDNLHLP